MCDCEKALDWISLDLDGALTPQERRELEDHLAVCPGCAALARELAALHRVLPELEEEVPEGFHQAVMERVRAEKVQALPAGRGRAVPWRRWLSLAAVCAVVLAGAGSLGRFWDRSGGTEPAAGETLPVQAAQAGAAAQAEAAPQEEAAGEGQGPELRLYTAMADPSGAREAADSGEVLPEASPLPTVGAAMNQAAAQNEDLTEAQRAALTANCAAWLQTSGLDPAEAGLLTVEAVTQTDLEAAVCPGEDQRARLDLDDYRVTLGSSDVLLCDSATLEVLGYLPTV